MSRWLLNRLFIAKEQPKPRFAFQGTVNWMRALSIQVTNGLHEVEAVSDFYKDIRLRNSNQLADTRVFENMMMAYHNHAALVQLSTNTLHPYDVCRAAIISWYYSTYFTCSAMIAGASGVMQDTHAGTARALQSDVVKHGLLMNPFSLNLGSLRDSESEAEISAYRGINKHDLSRTPQSDDEAWGALVSYLSGTREYERGRVEEKLRGEKEFKELGVADFRKKQARELRDRRLDKASVNYLTQAFRFRGKANYRDSVFLSYGDDNTEKMVAFVNDLQIVSFALQRMAAAYLSRRVETGTWDLFVADLKENSRLILDPGYLNFRT